jgi:uncharacterized protein (TIGR03118 family)
MRASEVLHQGCRVYRCFGAPGRGFMFVIKRIGGLAIAAALLAGCGGAGTSDPLPPAVNITVSPTSATAFQKPLPQLTWSSTHADSCTGGGAFNGSQPPSGSMIVDDQSTGTFTYTLTCTGAGGTTSGSATLTVTPGVVVSVSPTSIPAFGGSVEVSWESSGVTACAPSGAWTAVGDAPSGLISVLADVAGQETYTMTCTTAAGSVVSSSATLTVTPGILIYWDPTPPLGGGVATTLGWYSSGTTGNCAASGAWSGSQPQNGTQTVALTSIGVYTYTLTCPTASGSISGSQVSTILPTLGALGGNVLELGDSVTLSWSAPGASTCSASWSGTEPPSGTFTFTPNATGSSTFNISCTGSMGTTSASTLVQVNPFVSFSVSPQTILAGQSATLSWSSAGAANCYADNAWSGAQSTSGQAITSPVFPGTYSYMFTCKDTNQNMTSANARLTVGPNGFAPTQLTANVSGAARNSDPGLLDPWGIAFPETHAAVVANNQGDTSTSYDGTGAQQSPGTGTSALAVRLPPGTGGAPFSPTGVVASPAGITVTAAGKSGPVQLIYAGESGMIAAWAPTVDPTNAIAVYADSGGAVYKSLAIAGNSLYVADFHNNKIDVFDATFVKQTGYPFIDPTLPAGYAPHGILFDGSRLYVAYAMQLAPDNRVAAAGAGLGIIDVFDVKGTFSSRLIAGGALNAPWGMAVASAPFCLGGTGSCSFAGALLVANTGDGTINGFDPTSGSPVGTLRDSNGTTVAISGLHGIAVGNRYANQPAFTLFYTAGGNDAGLFGRIDFGAAPKLHAPPEVSARISQNPVELYYSAIATATSPIGIAWLDVFNATPETYVGRFCCGYGEQLIGSLPYSIEATATDVDGNIATAIAPLP